MAFNEMASAFARRFSKIEYGGKQMSRDDEDVRAILQHMEKFPRTARYVRLIDECIEFFNANRGMEKPDECQAFRALSQRLRRLNSEDYATCERRHQHIKFLFGVNKALDESGFIFDVRCIIAKKAGETFLESNPVEKFYM